MDGGCGGQGHKIPGPGRGENRKSSVKCQFTGELFALFSLWQAKKLQDDKMHLSFFFVL